MHHAECETYHFGAELGAVVYQYGSLDILAVVSLF